jgi:thiol-disulfide isomerase/thioredoxin
MRTLLAAVLWLTVLPSLALDESSLRSQHMQRLEEPAPDFVLHDASGTALRLAALHGHPVIVHFWATWCRSCRKELPLIQALARRLADTDVAFLAVAIDTDVGAADIRAYAARLGVTLPVFRAGDGEISDRYWSWGIPVTYLIDRDGAIAGRALGPRDWTSDSMLAVMKRFAAH